MKTSRFNGMKSKVMAAALVACLASMGALGVACSSGGSSTPATGAASQAATTAATQESGPATLDFSSISTSSISSFADALQSSYATTDGGYPSFNSSEEMADADWTGLSASEASSLAGEWTIMLNKGSGSYVSEDELASTSKIDGFIYVEIVDNANLTCDEAAQLAQKHGLNMSMAAGSRNGDSLGINSTTDDYYMEISGAHLNGYTLVSIIVQPFDSKSDYNDRYDQIKQMQLTMSNSYDEIFIV